MILMLVGLMGATGVIQVWPHAKRLWSLVATWAFPVSDVKDPKEPFHVSSCTDEKTQDVGRLKAIGVFDRKPRIGTARRNRPGRNGVWQNWESASWVSTFASRIKKLSEFWGKVWQSHFLTAGFSFWIHWWCPGWGDGMWGLSDIWNVARCGLGQQKRVRRSLHKWFSCDRPLPSEKILSKALFKQGWIYLNPLQCQTWWMRGLFQSFTTFVDDSGFSTLQVVKFFCFFWRLHRRTVGKAGTFSCGTLPRCGWTSTTIPCVKIVTASLPGSSIFCGQTPSKMEWMQTQLPSVPTLRATQQSRRINLQGTRRVSEWKRGTIWTDQQNPVNETLSL